MTTRTAWPLQPAELIKRFVSRASHLATKALPVYRPEAEQRAAAVRVAVTLGGTYGVALDGEPIHRGRDHELEEIAKRLTQHAVRQLHVEHQQTLLSKMELRQWEEAANVPPRFFE